MLILCLTLTTGTLCHAQLKKTLHTTFELPDSSRQLVFDFYDNYTVVPWAGNTVMTEANIHMYQSSAAILQFFIDKGRYDFELQMTGADSSAVVLAAKDQKRLAIKSGDKQAYEAIEVRVYIPDSFQQSDTHTWTRTIAPNNAHIARAKLDRERANVSKELQEAVQPQVESTDSTETVIPLIPPKSEEKEKQGND